MKLNTPTIANAFKNEAMDTVEQGLKKLEENWKNTEFKTCKTCGGMRFDPEDGSSCIACDSTGIDMKIEYGVEDGKFFSRVTQNGIAAVSALCEEYKQAERSMGLVQRANSWIRPYLLPSAARMELEASRPDFKEAEDAGEIIKAAKIVRRHYPQFMSTTYKF